MTALPPLAPALPAAFFVLAAAIAGWEAWMSRRCTRHTPSAARAAWTLVAVCAALGTTMLAGCSAIAPEPRPVSYRCDEGRAFSVIYLPASRAAIIDMQGMRFDLDAEPAKGTTERYGCGVLTLWRDGESARVEMQGERMYENCRVVPTLSLR